MHPSHTAWPVIAPHSADGRNEVAYRQRKTKFGQSCDPRRRMNPNRRFLGFALAVAVGILAGAGICSSQAKSEQSAPQPTAMTDCIRDTLGQLQLKDPATPAILSGLVGYCYSALRS